MANITKESEEIEDTKQRTIKEPKKHDSTKIVAYLKQHWGEYANYEKETKTVFLCDNSILGQPAFVELMKKYKFFIQPSLF
jgi:hypothetical protein